MKKLAVLGASGHGKVVADLAEQLGYSCFFFDDAWPKKQKISVWPILGDTEKLISDLHDFTGVIVAIGNNKIRQEKQQFLVSKGAELPVLIHPHALVSKYAILKKGTVVFAGAVINADIKIGEGVIINTGCTVDHDCELGDFSHISPGANLAGAVAIGQRAWVGIGAAIRQQIKVGSYAVVGAGAVVTKDVPAGVTVVGNPAKPLVK